MTDHDWEADGRLSRSARAANASAGDSSRGSTDPIATNVVPFPGSWFGSVRDLVPVHPREETSKGTPTVPPSSESSSERAPDANAFWDGETGPLQEVVPVALEADASRDQVLLTSDSDPTASAERVVGRGRGWASPILMGLLAVAVAGGAPLMANALRVGRSPAARQPGVHTTPADGTDKRRVMTVPSSVTVTRTVPANPTRDSESGANLNLGRGGVLREPRHGGASSHPGAEGDNRSAATSVTHQSVTESAHTNPVPTAAANGGSSRPAASDPVVNLSSVRPTSACSTQSPDSGCLP